jgi:spore maturation protein CgeB
VRRGPLARAAFLPAVYGAELPLAFATGAITINILRWGNYDAHNMRSFEAPACGAFTLTTRSRELAELFREGDEIAFFGAREDLVEKVTYYLDHPGERRRIADAALRRIEPETYDARARSILTAVGFAAHAA